MQHKKHNKINQTLYNQFVADTENLLSLEETRVFPECIHFLAESLLLQKAELSDSHIETIQYISELCALLTKNNPEALYAYLDSVFSNNEGTYYEDLREDMAYLMLQLGFSDKEARKENMYTLWQLREYTGEMAHLFLMAHRIAA